MNPYRVTFIGHRRLDNHGELEAKLMPILTELLQTKDFVEFQLGRNGEFDILAASCIKQAQKLCGNHNSAMSLILPYPVADMQYYEKYYDDVFIPERLEGVHHKRVITVRNKWLIENSELLIAYAHSETGGAADCLRSARKSDIEIIVI